VNRRVSNLIAEELVEYRQGIQPLPKVFSRECSEFDQMLVDMVSLPEIIEEMRYATSHALGKINDSSFISKLSEEIYKEVEENSKVAYDSIFDAMRNLEKGPFMSELFKVLSPALFDEKERYKHKKARQILQLSTQVSNIEGFAEKLTHRHIEGSTRKVMARLIGIVGKPSLVPKLVEMLSHGEIDSEVRGGIADAIRKLGQKLVEPAEIKEFCGELVDALPKANKDTRSKLISVIETFGDESTASKLAEKLDDKDIDRSVRQEMLQLAERLLLLRC
jgi:hypothetical protein